jgi:tungstate transport system permease protein
MIADNVFEISNIVWTSLTVSTLAVVISALIGIPIGIIVGLSDERPRRLIMPVVHAGMALPPVVVGLVLYLLFSRSGVLGSLELLFTIKAMVIAQVILALPFVVGITVAATRSIPSNLVWQLESLGASRRQIRWTILREVRGGIILAVASAFGRSMSEVGAVMIVGGNIAGQTRTMTTAIVLKTNEGHFGLALWLAAILLVIALSVNIAIARFQYVRSSDAK